jgi:hypothetical protein
MAVRTRIALLLVIAAVAAVGVTAAPVAIGAPLRANAAGQSGETAPQTMRRVVRAWTRLLNAGDNAGIARLFGLPALLTQDSDTYKLTTAKQIAIWHEGLPCSGRLTAIHIAGRFATAVFVLGNRKTSTCDAPGLKAAARFEIVRGKIIAWQQVAVPAAPAPSTTA